MHSICNVVANWQNDYSCRILTTSHGYLIHWSVMPLMNWARIMPPNFSSHLSIKNLITFLHICRKRFSILLVCVKNGAWELPDHAIDSQTLRFFNRWRKGTWEAEIKRVAGIAAKPLLFLGLMAWKRRSASEGDMLYKTMEAKAGLHVHVYDCVMVHRWDCKPFVFSKHLIKNLWVLRIRILTQGKLTKKCLAKSYITFFNAY